MIDIKTIANRLYIFVHSRCTTILAYHDKQEREVFNELNYHDKFKLIIATMSLFKKRRKTKEKYNDF